MLLSGKKRGSKRTKKSWRKNIDLADVDEFLEEKLRDERIGSLENKKDEELFIIDTKKDVSCLTNKKLKAFEPLRCFQNLIPNSAVQDPIIKRNRVRTKEERKDPIRKRIEELKRSKGIISQRQREAQKQRELAITKKKEQRKGLTFKKDLWTPTQEAPVIQTKWLSSDTLRHTLTKTGKLKVKIPKGILIKKSVTPSIEIPHPGTSYNPSYQDHQALLQAVADKELNIQKEEAHIARTTTNMFSKVTPKEKEDTWLKEMSQGLVKEEEDVDYGNEYTSINPPTSFKKKKTLKQRRVQKELRMAALLRKELKIEKRKISDIYKLKLLHSTIEEKEKKQVQIWKKRKEISASKKLETKRLGAQKFSEPDLDFSRSCELKGNLRSSKPEGNLLADRFYSFQKRNLLVPSDKVTKFKKAKVKRFVKPSHKDET